MSNSIDLDAIAVNAESIAAGIEAMPRHPFATKEEAEGVANYCIWRWGIPARAYHNVTDDLYLVVWHLSGFAKRGCGRHHETAIAAGIAPWIRGIATKTLAPWRKRYSQARGVQLPLLGLRDGWGCHYCGKYLLPCGVPVEWYFQTSYCAASGVTEITYGASHPVQLGCCEHKIPKFKGGTQDLCNLVLTCSFCNGRKGYRRTYEEFYAMTEPERTARQNPYVEVAR